MNLFRTRKLFGIDQLHRIYHPHVCRMSTTPPAWSPPPDTLSGNHPEPVPHPRMISRSEPDTLYCVRSPITIHLSCHALIAIVYFVFTFSPPLIFGRLCCYRWLHRCRLRLRRRRQYPYRRASRQAVPLPFSPISPICLYFICCIRHCCWCSLNSYSVA